MFGAPASSSAFGVSAPLFGAASTPTSAPAFSFPAPAFGAPSAPAFGAAAPSAPAFGLSPAPAFGATSAPAFGAASSSAFSFGGPAASTGLSFSAFGAATSQPASAPSLFAPATTPSLFGGAGATSSAFPALGGFGALPTSTFGASQPASGLGSAQASLQPQGSFISPDDATKKVADIAATYNPSTPSYKFHHLFLNVVDNPAQRLKPANVDEVQWRQAMSAAGGDDNADKLWPVQASGFQDLLARSATQASAMQENRDRLTALMDLSKKLQRRQEGEFKARITEAQRMHSELSHKMIKACRSIDALEGHLASVVGFYSPDTSTREQNLGKQLEVLDSELASAPSALLRRLESLVAEVRLRGDRPPVSGTNGAVAATLDDASTQQVFKVLNDHAEAIKRLQAVLKADQLDVEIMAAELAASDQ